MGAAVSIKTIGLNQTRLNLAALGFFGVFSLLILHPMLFATGTHFAGFDYFNYHWNMWWIRHALTTPGLSVYESNYVFFPAVNNFGYHALSAFWFPTWAVLEPFVGTFTAFNVILVICCTLNGYLMFALLREEGVSVPWALLGGFILQTLPITRYSLYNTHLNLMNWFWLPAHLLLWRRVVASVESGDLRRVAGWAVLHALAIWGLGLSDLQFPIFVGFLLVPYGLYTLWRSPRRVRIAAVGVVIVGIAAVLLWAFGPLPHIVRFRGTLAPGSVENRPGIPFPLGYLTTSETWWEWNTPSLGASVTVLVLASLAVSIVSTLRRKATHSPYNPNKPITPRLFWLLVMLPPLIFSMGPDIVIGDLRIPMPFRLLHAQTNGMFGMPWRLAPIYVIAALVFIGQTATTRGWAKLSPLAVAAIIFLVGIDVRVFESAPLKPLPPRYTFYETMRDEPYDYVVVEVPTGVGTGEVLLGKQEAIQLQLYGMIHEKRTVNGFISRAPVESFWWVFTDDPMFAWLGQRRMLEADTVREQLRQRIWEWQIGYIVIHKNLIDPYDPARSEIVGFLNGLPDLVCPAFLEGDAVVYRTAWHPDGFAENCPPRTPESVNGDYRINIGEQGDDRFIGAGWHNPEAVPGTMVRWSGREPQAEIVVDVPPGAYTLTVHAQAFHQPRELSVTVNGEAVGVAMVSENGFTSLSFDVPESAIGEGRSVRVVLQYDGATSPAEAGLGGDVRTLNAMVDWISFTRR
jgi:hypothetical protein